MNPMVSMITYCFNGERFVSKYFDAILAQTYDNIELIFFNNGSVDNTGKIAEEYRKKLEARGIKTKIIHYEENQSTCQLKQDAFHMMEGEYFFGCDSDDLIDPDYITTMISYLREHPEKGIVYCQLRVIEEETGIQKSIMKMIPRYKDKEAFVDILYGTNINFTAISYMMSKEHYERINPGMNIFISVYGENYQIQIPFLYHNLQGYIESPLGQYTVRKDSYTGTLDFEKKVKALKGQEESVIATLRQIGAEKKYEALFLKRIRRDRFYASLLLKERHIVKECYEEYCDSGKLKAKDRFAFLLYKMGLYKTAQNLKCSIIKKR